MALIGIMAAFVLPRVGGNADRLRLRTAIKDVASMMRYARSQAVTRGRDFSVIVESEGNRIVVIPADSTAAGEDGHQNDGSNGSERVYDLPDGVMLDFPSIDNGENGSRILLAVFFSMGNSSGGRVILKNNKDEKRAIDVDLITGAVKIIE